MNIQKYIGFKFNEIQPMLDSLNIKYEIVEVWDTKKTKLGDDLRIINFKEDPSLVIYVSYF
jgi:hypothetical protein